MPNRILKDGIRTSKKINALSDFQFRLWAYLITYVDDYGRGSADPEILKGFVFPRRKRVTESDIEKALAELAGTGCILLYKVDGESYFYFPNWGEHQRIQTKKSRFPEPPDFTDNSHDSADIDSNSPNVTVNHGESPWVTVGHRDSPPESESESEYKSESIITHTSTPYACAEPCDVSTPSASLPVIDLPLVDGTDYGVTREFADEMTKLYPAVDVMQALNAMRGWLIDNQSTRKTKSGIKRFVTSWLAREQDRGGNRGKGGSDKRNDASVFSGDGASYDIDEVERLILSGEWTPPLTHDAADGTKGDKK